LWELNLELHKNVTRIMETKGKKIKFSNNILKFINNVNNILKFSNNVFLYYNKKISKNIKLEK
jgi:hypothetical protein